ncbi:LysR family transcriptional regulator [Dyella sp.]|uniref:LysR family transcriptional regulator n=1 Tax=Dyella sp. TaxID=1869338 RepID=UPI002ED45C03
MALLTSVNLNRIVVFVAVVESGSFTAAATRLGMAKTMVSTHVQRLETELGATLLVRSTRRLALTDAGEAFFAASRDLVRDAEAAVQAASEDVTALRGTLRITAPVDYAANMIAPLVTRMRHEHPQLRVDMLAGDRLFDLVAEGIDVAIRVGNLTDSSLRATRIDSYEHWLVAAPSFLQERKRPRRPEDVADWPYVAMNVLARPSTWTFTRANGDSRTVAFNQVMSANIAVVVKSAVIAGGGITMMPDFAAREDVAAGRLQRLLPSWQLPGGGVHAVYPAARFLPHRARMFIEALRGVVGR